MAQLPSIDPATLPGPASNRNAVLSGQVAPTILTVSPVAAPISGQIWPIGEILNPLPPDTFTMTISGGTTVLVTHNLATKDVVVAIYRLSDGVEVDVPFTRTSINAITLNSAVDLAGHRVVVVASGGSEGAVTLPGRSTATITTASLAVDASESGTVTLTNGYRLLKIITNRPARVRLYTLAAKRDADAARAIGTDPTGDHGLVMETVTTASLLSIEATPAIDGYDGKTTPDGVIPYHVTNKDSGAGIVTCSFAWLRTE